MMSAKISKGLFMIRTMDAITKMFSVGGKKDEPPSPQMAIQKLRETEVMLGKKTEFLEKKIDFELREAKKHGTRNKRAALMALKRKKRLEKQLNVIDGTLSTIEFQREALENAQTNIEVLKTMSSAAKALKQTQQNFNLDKIHDMLDDIQEQNELSDEIMTIFSQPIGVGSELDEDDLLAELEELEQEDKDLLEVGQPSFTTKIDSLDDLPVPSKAVPTVKVEEEDDDLRKLAAWAQPL